MKTLHASALVFTFLVASVAAIAQSGTIDINGNKYAVDTLEHYMVGPGVDYTRFDVTIDNKLHQLYLLETDLTNPYNSVEEHQSGNLMGKTETLASAHKSMNEEAHRTIGGVNCNFWVVSSNITQSAEATRVWSGLLGQPFSGTAHGGVLIGDPSENWNRGRADSNPNKEVGFVMIDGSKRVFIDDMRYVAYVEHNGERHPLRDCNRTRENPDENELVIFNHYTYSATASRSVSNGVEAVLQLQGDWAINKDLVCNVTNVNTTGGTKINEGYAILQGRGTGKTFLEKVKQGDALTVHLGVVNRTDSTLRPDIKEMVTGNCLVMENGVLTNRNTNEGYNNQNYPRTMLATNNEGNRFWMLVSAPPGNYTAEMCGILKNCGATYAVGMDGGGSAQMCLHGKVQNKTTETNPRAVANSIWVFSTAPEDSVAASLSSSTKEIRLPRYCIAKPLFNVYNQYGALLKHDFADVTLSCTPETGYITEDGKFVCLGNGTLTATYQNATLNIPVVNVESTSPSIVFDSVWIDQRHNYQVETSTTSNGVTYPVLSSAMQWQVLDPDVCSSTADGVITGVSNGVTTVYGTLEGKTDSLVVTTEIAATNPLLLTDFSEENDMWKPTSTSSVSTLTFTPSSNGGLLRFQYKKSRAPIINFTNNILLYSLPSAVRITFEKRNFPITQLSMNLQPHNGKVQTYGMSSFNEGDEQVMEVDVEKLLGKSISIYPLRLTGLRLQFDASADEGDYTLLLKKLELVYGDEQTRLTDIKESNTGIRKVMTNGQLLIIRNNKTYNLLGYEIR